jgi:glutaredoxin
MYRCIISVILFNFLYLHNSLAVEVVQCEDAEGNRSFRAYCPPDMTLVGEKKVPTKTHPRPDITPTVYYASKCPACDAVMKYFQSKKIDIEGKNIDGNQELQDELRGFAGNLKIPTIIIGTRVLSDYKPAEIDSALMDVGFTEQDLNE